MKDNRRSILKQLLLGNLSADKAASELERARTGISPVSLVVRHENGLYSFGDDHNLSEAQMQDKVKNLVHVIIDEDDSLLGGRGPTLLGGTDGRVFIIPDNGRD